MKIDILDPVSPGSGTPFVLFAGGLVSPEDPHEANHEDQIQIAQGLRAVAAKVYNRGNTVFSLPLKWTVDYGSVNAAEKAFLRFPATVPNSGIIRFTPESPAGDGSDVTWLVNATLHQSKPRLIGQAVVWNFLITGGQITATQPY